MENITITETVIAPGAGAVAAPVPLVAMPTHVLWAEIFAHPANTGSVKTSFPGNATPVLDIQYGLNPAMVGMGLGFNLANILVSLTVATDKLVVRSYTRPGYST